MNVLFVVSEADDWATDIPGAAVMPAAAYLTDPAYGAVRSTMVINLCRSTRYLSHGYYVSLLAEARGHRPLPDAQAIKACHADDLIANTSGQLGALFDCALAPVDDDVVELDIYFGRDADDRQPYLCAELFRLLRMPLLHARFERAKGRWQLCGLYPGNVRDIPGRRRRLAHQAAFDHLKLQNIRSGTPPGSQPSVAVLHDPQRVEAPSNPLALRKFIDAAAALGMRAELITPREMARLFAFDALFIRDTTNVNHYTYQIARQAASAGMVVIDDADSILRCTDKIYLKELLARHHVHTPRALVVQNSNVDQIVATLGLPCILKQPDGAFSEGVSKVESEQQLHTRLKAMLADSELILAQEYLPTDFDWRVGVLDGRALFVCKYYMAPGHWQIIRREGQRASVGRTEALSVGEAPDAVVDAALAAASLIGDGFYGVDLKQIGAQVYVIEVNDNPNVDAGNEDAVLSDALYRDVMGVFRKRIDALKGNNT